MRSRKFILIAAIAVLEILAAGWGLSTAVKAGLDVDAHIPAGPTMELVVMEAPGCIYCTLFRRDVLPSYAASERAKDVPVRFVDINDESADALGLEGPVDVVPTFIVLRNNHEIGRIPGYLGPEFFFHSINYLISSQ